MDDQFSSLLVNSNTKTYRYFDGNEWRESTSGKTVQVISPIDGQLMGEVQSVTPAEIDTVITRAKAVQPTWERVSLFERMKLLGQAATLMRKYQDVLTDVLVREIGKSQQESQKEVRRTADMVDYFVREVQSIHGQLVASDSFPGFGVGPLALVNRVARGVIVAIGPFNYPINLTVSKIVPALLMGNTVILKPPTQGSIAGLYITKVFLELGLPQGVLSCVTGEGKEIGNFLVTHPDVAMVAFTGSSQVGESIAKQIGMTPLLFECGGNNPAIVFPDADLELTAKEIVIGGFSYTGQRCTGLKYVLGEAAVLDQLLPLVVKKTQELVYMGDPRDNKTTLVGPLISESAAARVESVVTEAVNQGAQLVIGGKRNSTYFEPTILTHVTPSMNVVVEETFGPVISFVPVKNSEEAISIINQSQYGLQASLFTRDEGSAIALANQIQTGTVQINGSPQRGPDHFPFLGIKKSGIGVQGVRYSLEAMSRLQCVVINKS